MIYEMRKAIAAILALVTAFQATAQNNPSVDLEIKQFEQQKIKSEKEYYGDIPARITKVVSSGDNSMADLMFRNAVEENWNISPFEFCDYEEFDQLRTDTNYYFLLRLDKQHRKDTDPSMEFICFLKGNGKAAGDIAAMPELLALPLYPEGDESDRIFSYLPAYMNIIQNYIQKIVDGKIYPSKRGKIYPGTPDKSRNSSILFNKEDMAYMPPMQEFEKMFRGRAETVSQKNIDTALDTAAARTLVSLTVFPSAEGKGAYCYKMLISADTYELFYYKRHRITPKKGAGFLKSDLRRISRLVTPDFKSR